MLLANRLGTPRELLSEDGALVWAAEYGTWGGVRRFWQADNDNEDLNRGDLQGYDLDGKPVYAARFQTSGNLALKPLENPDPLFCPIRFQGQWADEETGLYYNRFRYYDPLSAQYLSPDPIGILGGFNSQAYVHNPGSWIDPLGLNRKKCCSNMSVGDKVDTPDSKPEEYTKLKGGQGYKHNKTGEIWQKSHTQHSGGPEWKVGIGKGNLPTKGSKVTVDAATGKILKIEP